jgi:D-glycero-alpha-D-manno-heptose 1-phosphate guanylyltransferase
MSNFEEVTGVILAGGMGTRLRQVVSDRPKVMAEIKGKPFILYLLDQLAEVNIERVIISTGYMADTIEDNIGRSYKNICIEYSKEEVPLGTAGALKLAGRTVNTEDCLVMNGDSYTEFDATTLYLAHKQKNANITLVVKALDETDRFGVVSKNKNNEIIDFMEKGSNKGSGFINSGIYLMKTSVIHKIPKKPPCSLEYDFFPSMVGKSIYSDETKGDFIDIGTPESFAHAERFFKQLSVNI